MLDVKIKDDNWVVLSYLNYDYLFNILYIQTPEEIVEQYLTS